MEESTKTWRLKRGSDRRVRAGHPWIYSNELKESPKGITPGQKVQLADPVGRFLAHGYGNPSSLIAFRVVSRVESDTEWDSLPRITARLQAAWDFRVGLGLDQASFRWMFGEGDDFPGLILDVYQLESGKRVVAIQAHTAGVDRLLSVIIQAVESIAEPVSIVIRNDVSQRKLEGLAILAPETPGEPPPADELILVRSADPGADPNAEVSLKFRIDLVHGQKTGFFLDQSENIRQFLDIVLRSLNQQTGTTPIRVLDLCCYVGQWSSQIAAALKARGVSTEVLLVDASAPALALARENAERAGATVGVLETDVLADLSKLESAPFDIVICDPPALIPNRKDISVGAAAYLKLNTQAFRLLAPKGWLVTCSCSQLLNEETFSRQITRAMLRNRKDMRWLARGTQALDHPLRLEFTEGKYLKMWIGRDSGRPRDAG